MSDEKKIEWDVTVQAFALLGYEFKPPVGFMQHTTEVQLLMWGVFLTQWRECEMLCAWKGGNRCLSDLCPRDVLRRVSVHSLPPEGLHPAAQEASAFINKLIDK